MAFWNPRCATQFIIGKLIGAHEYSMRFYEGLMQAGRRAFALRGCGNLSRRCCSEAKTPFLGFRKPDFPFYEGQNVA